MNTLLVVDGTNIVARCSLGGPVPPDRAAATAVRMIARVAVALDVSHLVVCVDGGGASWRHALAPDYKAGRSLDTRPHSDAIQTAARAAGWCVLREPAAEADDVIATVAHRAATIAGAYDVILYSGDSDVAQCCQGRTDLRGSVTLCRPMPASHPTGPWVLLDAADVCHEHGLVGEPAQLAELKAIAGEDGDNVVGAYGRTPKGRVSVQLAKAKKLLAKYGSLDAVIAAGATDSCPESTAVFAAREAVGVAIQMTRLRTDVALPRLSARLTRFVPIDAPRDAAVGVAA